MGAKIAIAGAGIYGATAAIRLAERGHQVTLFDPLGVMRAASAINQYRVHSGYHYPRSPETIAETLEARREFIQEFAPAIVQNSRHHYAIPREGSRTRPPEYEQIMRSHGLPLRACRPEWMDFGYIDQCYEVEENIYDPDLLRSVIESRLYGLGIRFEERAFLREMRGDYDFVVWATYGMGPSRDIFRIAKYQVAEKILIELPAELRGIALVVVDGPFTAFDPYGGSDHSLFGSAKHTNHWTTSNPEEPIPERYLGVLNQREFVPFEDTRFEAMQEDCCLTVPAAKHAKYIGSRFTLRVVEDNPEQDRRILYVRDGLPGEIHIFSGKVVGAAKAARMVCDKIAAHG
ncbi:MAG TPA: FAD-dependent oxidoreductase [Verrucomicrobiae bacterium]|nr:FAD-dependent oxidoreductase [Verrucomicrobiae bacterium]